MNPLHDPYLDQRLAIESGKGLSRTFKIAACMLAALAIVIIVTFPF